MSDIYIFGHKNPDTDTICSAITYANLKNKLSMPSKACRLGKINDETNFVLEYLNIKAPVLIENILNNQGVILVDHNEFSQSVKNIQNANILEVVDHHRVANFQTANPIVINIRPVGCTATLIYKEYISNDVEIDETNAVLMLSAIISDTLLFKSPTCTNEDEDTAKKLAGIAKLDVYDYGMQMLRASTNLNGYKAKELLDIDSKSFTTAKGDFIVAQVNTTDTKEFFEVFEKDLLDEISKTISDKGLDMYILMVTDIISSNTKALVLGSKVDIFEKAFEVKLVSNMAMLNGVVSRKKQVVPFL